MLLLVLGVLLAGSVNQVQAQYGEEHDFSYDYSPNDDWFQDFLDNQIEWMHIWDLVDQVNEQNYDEYQDWINDCNEWVMDNIEESDAFWQDFYSNSSGSYEDWLDYIEWLQNQNNNNNNNPPPTCATDVQFKEDPSRKYGYDNYGPNASVPWKSLQSGQTDKLKVEITAPADYASAFFKVVTSGNVTLSAASAPSATFDLTLTGPTLSATDTKKETDVEANCNSISGANIDKVKVVTYPLITKTVAVRLVHSAVNAGAGAAGYTSTDISDADIIAFLNTECYNQAIVKWTVVRLTAKTVDFDLDGDEKIDVNSWMSAEMIKVRDECKDDSYDANIFLVDKSSDNSTGYMAFNQKYGFVHANHSVRPPSTFAHELGHGTFGLTHQSSDPDNIMYDFNSATKFRLRKFQWDLIHP
jgi:hypothetical protein